MSIKDYKNLHTAQTIPSVGDRISTAAADTLIVAITGTSTSFTLQFQGSLDGTNFFNIEANKCSDSTVLATSTSVVGDAWEIDVTAWSSFRANLTAIGNGYISIVATTA